MSPEGTWDLTIATPVGRIEAVTRFRYDDGVLTGTAQGAGQEVPLTHLVRDGDRLTWRQSVTKPLRLDLTFAVTLAGDTLTGTSRAGRLPASRVTGERRAERAGTGHRP
ncbi:hypothetical protein FRZ03_08130 [Streptomyces misionensis]|uniref:Uncharacterized protein n=1 Tax=Streptomyces misionensis TaxID=67331 RepID=A0A5C6K0Y1_9ACTN|nr:hypothetical protein [Streptomyces misionensis]TWV53923.1 hypothetical protein FRZ03_08130 [Streptomyces misionensis]